MLNSTSKYIWGKIPDVPFSQELHRAQPLNDVILTPQLEEIWRGVKGTMQLLPQNGHFWALQGNLQISD